MDRSNRSRSKPAKRLFGNVFKNDDAEVFKGVVTDVILDETNPLVTEGIVGLGKIGHISFIPMNKGSVEGDGGDNFAAPMDKNFNTLPIKNEKVDIFNTKTGYFYRRSNDNITPNIDTSPTLISDFFKRFEEKRK